MHSGSFMEDPAGLIGLPGFVLQNVSRLLWGARRAGVTSTNVGIEAFDTTLDRWVEWCGSCDVICQHLVHDVLSGGPGEEVGIPIATTGHEVVLSDHIA